MKSGSAWWFHGARSTTPPLVRRREFHEGTGGTVIALALMVAALGCGGGGKAANAGSGGGAPPGTGGAAGTGPGAGGSPDAGTAGTGGVPTPTGGAEAADAGLGGASAGCQWTLGKGQMVAGPAPTGNNSADLRGPALGDLTFNASTDRRTIPVQVGTTLAGFQVGPAYLTRSNSTAQSFDLTIPVTNGGTDYPCFVAATTFHYLSTAGTVMNAPDDTEFVDGAVGDLGHGMYTHSCLGPGDTGYFVDSRSTAGTPYFAGTASIQIDLASEFAGTAPAGRLTPTEYELGTCDGIRKVRVTGVNSSTSTIAIASSGIGLGPAILLDDGGLPAGWIFLEEDNLVQLAPGETTFFTSELSDSPAVSRARLFLDFEMPAMAAFERAAVPEALATALQKVRVNRLERLARWRAGVDRVTATAPFPRIARR